MDLGAIWSTHLKPLSTCWMICSMEVKDCHVLGVVGRPQADHLHLEKCRGDRLFHFLLRTAFSLFPRVCILYTWFDMEACIACIYKHGRTLMWRQSPPCRLGDVRYDIHILCFLISEQTCSEADGKKTGAGIFLSGAKCSCMSSSSNIIVLRGQFQSSILQSETFTWNWNAPLGTRKIKQGYWSASSAHMHALQEIDSREVVTTIFLLVYSFFK